MIKEKYCTECGVKLKDSNWHKASKRKNYYTCKSCLFIKNKNNRFKKYSQYIIKSKLADKICFSECKRIMKQLKINGCAICGYNKCNESLHFHHVNSKDKKFHITKDNLRRKDKTIVEELNKCILICANCHGEIHQEERDA